MTFIYITSLLSHCNLQLDKSPSEPKEVGDDIAKSSEKLDKFEENYKELIKWVDVKSNKYSMLFVVRERRYGRLGTALKVFFLPFSAVLQHGTTPQP
jgi:hypothetical protein